jgi:hypothetical protein
VSKGRLTVEDMFYPDRFAKAAVEAHEIAMRAKEDAVSSKPKRACAYRKPVGPRIGRGPETETLYSLEHRTVEAFRRAAEEHGRVLGLEGGFFQEVLPEALLSFLEGWDNKAVRLAVGAWLEKHAKGEDS